MRRPNAISQFLAGVGLLGRGLALYTRSPRLLVLGLVPAVISGVLFLVAYGALVFVVADLAAWLTPFAETWPDWARTATRLGAIVALLGLGALVAVLSFTTVTLLIGDPFYEKISEYVEERFGGVPDEVDQPWWVSLRVSVVDSARLLLWSLLVGVPLFLGGFLPIVGQTVVPVIGALAGGWLLAIELVSVPFSRRGLRLADSRARLRTHAPLALGFGVAVFCCFLIPLGAVLLMPAAVAGGTLLARRVVGLPIDPIR
ncbi:MAG TPA: EI24 domain-containing protein [Micromonospora sp.]